jgi:hypothetical protein
VGDENPNLATNKFNNLRPYLSAYGVYPRPTVGLDERGWTQTAVIPTHFLKMQDAYIFLPPSSWQ